MTPAEVETRWREHPLDALALIRATITDDMEGAHVITRYANQDRLLDWTVWLARSWLLAWCGSHSPGCGPYDVEAAALEYLDRLTACYTEDLAA